MSRELLLLFLPGFASKFARILLEIIVAHIFRKDEMLRRNKPLFQHYFNILKKGGEGYNFKGCMPCDKL